MSKCLGSANCTVALKRWQRVLHWAHVCMARECIQCAIDTSALHLIQLEELPPESTHTAPHREVEDQENYPKAVPILQ